MLGLAVMACMRRAKHGIERRSLQSTLSYVVVDVQISLGFAQSSGVMYIGGRVVNLSFAQLGGSVVVLEYRNSGVHQK
eukprot:6459812-Amphidinium_carterae.2